MSLHILLAVAVPGLACCEKAHWSTWSPLLQSSALGSSPATAGGEWQCREHSLCKRKYHFRLTSCLTGSDSTKLVYLYLIQYKQSSWILTSQPGGQSYSDTSPYKVSYWSLDNGKEILFSIAKIFDQFLTNFLCESPSHFSVSLLSLSPPLSLLLSLSPSLSLTHTHTLFLTYTSTQRAVL